jgi:hypothetical protein
MCGLRVFDLVVLDLLVLDLLVLDFEAKNQGRQNQGCAIGPNDRHIFDHEAIDQPEQHARVEHQQHHKGQIAGGFRSPNLEDLGQKGDGCQEPGNNPQHRGTIHNEFP